MLPRIAAFFSLSLDELFDYRAQLSEAESAALYAQVYAEAESNLPAAYAHLRRLVAEHYADANLLVLLASLLTMWAAGQASPFKAGAACPDDEPVPAGNEAAPRGAEPAEADADAMPDAETLRKEALALLDHVIEQADSPALVFYAQQQKATTLFQSGDPAGAIALLEPLVQRQNASAATMMLASAYRQVGHEDNAWRLLQLERLQAAGFVLSALTQEVGMTEDAGYARRAAAAGMALHEAFDMEAASPHYNLVMTLELAGALRRAGDRDGALDALARAVELAERLDAPDAAARPMLLFDRVADLLDPAGAGEGWAAHKARQENEMCARMQRAVAEQLADPAWFDFAGADPRYRELVCRAERLLSKGTIGFEG